MSNNTPSIQPQQQQGQVVKYYKLNRKFIDYRGLISKGLALAAPERMYNINEL